MQDNFTRELLQDLVSLRLRIKTRVKEQTGKSPIVCSDEALMNICRYQPQKLEDFYSIAGVGKAFVQNYGEEFLQVVLSKQPESAKTIDTSDDITNILKELEKRLVNINRRNRLLRLSKTARRHSFDLFNSANNDDLKALLFGNKRSLRICDLRYCADKDAERVKYRRLTYLLREANISLREKGQFDMYIGYPFVIGMMSNADFPVRAPLALFPVKINKEPTYISISIDSDKDILYNNTLVLAHNKFNNLLKPLPDNEIDEIDGEHFIEFVLKYYYSEKINIRYDEHDIIPFNEYMASEFPKFTHGELYLENCAVLGNFPVYASSLQRDFNSLIDKGTVNNLLVKLLDDFKEVDLSEEILYEENNDNNKKVDIDETKISYINDLNSSQEEVLAAINASDELVVQGPPGTGKSQTITSIIVDAAIKGHNVLMVSEKKAALDVIHSRLGDIADYSLLVDDTKNKSLFYNQLDSILNIHGEYTASSELEYLSESINESLSSLEKISDALYTPKQFGVEMYKLFQDNKGYDFSQKEDFTKYQTLRDNVPNEFYDLEYSALLNLYQMFNNKNITETLLLLFKSNKESYYLKRIKKNLTDFEIASLGYEWEQVKGDILDFRAMGFFSKIFNRKKIERDTKEYLDKYFASVDASFIKRMTDTIADNECLVDLDVYNRYFKSKALYSGLSKLEKKYFSLMRSMKSKLKTDIYSANQDIYNHVIYSYIEKFRQDNKDTLEVVENFDLVVREILELMSDKQNQTRKLALSKLYTSLNDNLFKSKRYGEIKRQAQSRRKISVHKFVEKFSFELFKGVRIWLLTPEVVSEILPLECGIFDLVIFDEASQMFIEKGIPSIFRAKKVVISGDHKQLRPSNLGKGRIDYDDETMINEETNAAIEEESLLDLARFKYDEVMLNYHYRSKYEELIAFSNYAFYKGRLYVTPNVDIPDEPPIKVVKVENGMWLDRCNEVEAREVVAQLKAFLSERRHEETIGIITFNANQRDMIMDVIDEESQNDDEFRLLIKEEMSRKENGEDVGLFVKNIENVQGDERDVIVFSIGYAENDKGKIVRNFGWLNQRAGENRLNVAISRAKKKIMIVTSIHPTELKVDDLRNDGPKLLKKYLEFCFAVSSQNKKEAEQLLTSMHQIKEKTTDTASGESLAKVVKESLQNRGYTVKEQVGIGGYKIDLAIVNDETGEYMLGIECDTKLYSNQNTTRERDIHRQKYLESRGWNIYRVWSTNWWKDMDDETEKIITILNDIQG